MKNQDSTRDLVAAFQARGGSVHVVATGARAIASDYTIYSAMRNGVRVAGDSVREARAAEHKSEAYLEAHRGAYHAARADGWGEELAQDYAELAAQTAMR